MNLILAVALGYLLGSIPVGLVVGKVVKGIDIREHGSGKIGVSNTFRILGLRAAIPVFVADWAKGFLTVMVARALGNSTAGQVAAALAAVAGHNWPLFIGFKGGRGVMPATGGLTAFSPSTALIAAGMAATTLVNSRYVSLASLSGTGTALLTMALLVALKKKPLAHFVYVFTAAAMIVFQHRDNITRLLSGTEPKLGEKAERIALRQNSKGVL